MSKKHGTDKEVHGMAVVWEEVYSRTQKIIDRVQTNRLDDIPSVDPDAPGLDDLFAFGEAVAQRRPFSPDESKAIRRAVRENARRS